MQLLKHIRQQQVENFGAFVVPSTRSHAIYAIRMQVSVENSRPIFSKFVNKRFHSSLRYVLGCELRTSVSSPIFNECGVKVNLCLDDSSVFMKLEQG